MHNGPNAAGVPLLRDGVRTAIASHHVGPGAGSARPWT
jgi:hypothetical protein